MQKRIEAHVAAFGEQNRDKIVAVPSNTGEGVHIYFDPERSLSPHPDQAADRQRTDSTGVVVVIDTDSEDSSSDLGSDLETIAPDTPPQRDQALPSSHLHAPKAPRYIKQENWREGSVESSGSVHDSMARLAERKKDPKAHLGGNAKGYLGFLEFQELRNQAKTEEEWIAILRRDYEGRVERFREENKEIFSFPPRDMAEYFDPSSPEPFDHGDLPLHPLLRQSAGPSRLGQGIQEGRNQHQQPTLLRRHGAAASVGADEHFVVVARRVQKLGPCGTVVLDHDTGEEKVVTKRYRVREEELYSLDGDGDSVMGSDDD